MSIQELITGLMKQDTQTRSTHVQYRIARALSDIKHARTLLEKAETTLLWAQQYRTQLTKGQ